MRPLGASSTKILTVGTRSEASGEHRRVETLACLGAQPGPRTPLTQACGSCVTDITLTRTIMLVHNNGILLAIRDVVVVGTTDQVVGMRIVTVRRSGMIALCVLRSLTIGRSGEGWLS